MSRTVSGVVCCGTWGVHMSQKVGHFDFELQQMTFELSRAAGNSTAVRLRGMEGVFGNVVGVNSQLPRVSMTYPDADEEFRYLNWF